MADKLAYDNTCPRCSEPVAEDVARTCCGDCSAYHHAECWQRTGGCSGCGGSTTLADKAQARRDRRRRLIGILGILAVITVVVWIVSIPCSVSLPITDVLAIDLLEVLRWLLLVPICWVVTRIR